METCCRVFNPETERIWPCPHRPIIPLDTIGKLFERILLTRNLFEIGRRALLCNEQFGFRAKHSTALQLTLLIERVSRNFSEKRLTGAVFLVVAKTFRTLWGDGLICKLRVLNFFPGTL